jgi:hypothetical protein
MQKTLLLALALIALATASLLVAPPEPAESGGWEGEMIYGNRGTIPRTADQVWVRSARP